MFWTNFVIFFSKLFWKILKLKFKKKHLGFFLNSIIQYWTCFWKKKLLFFLFLGGKIRQIFYIKKKSWNKTEFMFPVVSSSVPFLCTLLFSKGLARKQQGRKGEREREEEEEEEGEEGKCKRRIVWELKWEKGSKLYIYICFSAWGLLSQ